MTDNQITPIKINRIVIFCKNYWPLIVIALLLFLSLISIGHAEGKDFMLPMKDNVKSTFGDGSFAQQMLYLGEALLAAVAYIKTKNVMILAGLPVLMIVTHFTMGVIA